MPKNHKLGTLLIWYNLNYYNSFPKAVCAHTEDAQSDLNHFLLTFSRLSFTWLLGCGCIYVGSERYQCPCHTNSRSFWTLATPRNKKCMKEGRRRSKIRTFISPSWAIPSWTDSDCNFAPSSDTFLQAIPFAFLCPNTFCLTPQV